jgi:hypothetical protein
MCPSRQRRSDREANCTRFAIQVVQCEAIDKLRNSTAIKNYSQLGLGTMLADVRLSTCRLTRTRRTADAGLAGRRAAQDKFKVGHHLHHHRRHGAAMWLGDAAVVESITKPGAEIHNYQPTPRDIVKAGTGCRPVLWNGLNLELWFEKFFAERRDVPGVVVTDGIEPMGIAEGPLYRQAESACLDVDDNAADLCRQHPQGVWSSTTRPMPRPTRPMPRPTRRDPCDARAVREIIAAVPEERRWLVTSEGAFSYLARDLGLRSSISGRSMPTSRAHRSRCAR